MTAPIRISLKDLDQPTIGELTTEEALVFDIGNLCVLDVSSVRREALEADKETALKELAANASAALLSKLSHLQRLTSKDTIVLPPPTTAIPRAKPLPTPKPLTRWEAFARSKGIKKRKKDKRVWDEGTGEWRRRYGYKRVNDPNDVIVMDAKSTDQPGVSPFEAMEDKKKNRVKRQTKREVRNLERATKQGHRLPSSVKLMSNLPEKGKGHPMRRKHLKDELIKASQLAGLSTASMGKFDEKQKGEAVNDRTSKRKKRTLVDAHEDGEATFMRKMGEKLSKEKEEGVLNVEKAAGRLEAEQRRQRHREKIDEEMKGNKKPRSQKKKFKRDEALPKLKVTSKQKKDKRRRKTHR